ncbi:MAG: putative DNA-binding domain-containing protein [Zoogloeaceae bacterium]|nr:putative DNA-binding domain-containing protein [Zoogloeaceae bacterium]
MAECVGEEALLDLFGEGLLNPRLTPADLFTGDLDRNARRFALYRGNLTANWERSLVNAYPVLQQMVGDEFFAGLARDYGRQVGSASGDLNEFGGALADFLTDFPPIAPYPYLPDLARLEWAVHRAYYAAEETPLSAEDLALLGADALEDDRIGLRSGYALFAAPWAVDALWQAHQTNPLGPLPNEMSAPCHVLISRPSWRVTIRSVLAAEWAALASLSAGQPLAAALEAGFDADSHFDPGATVQAWLGAGLLSHSDPRNRS